MKGNTDTCGWLLSKNDETHLEIGDSLIKNSTSEKLFDEHVKNICKKVNRKLRALARASPYIEIGIWKLLLTAVFNSQFNYYPLIWILNSRWNNNKVKYFHERCFPPTYLQWKTLFMRRTFAQDGSVFTQHKNIQEPVIEMFKNQNCFCPRDSKIYFCGTKWKQL